MTEMNTRNLPFYAGTARKYGLTEEQAIMALTRNPAKILGVDDVCGTIERGKDATLFISDGDALDVRTNYLITPLYRVVLLILIIARKSFTENSKRNTEQSH